MSIFRHLARLPRFRETIALTWLWYAELDDQNGTNFMNAAIGIHYFRQLGAIP